MYAAMMFDDSGASTFNPMRDVWFPLDLSNAASFNAVMAHSAAHLARMQGREISAEALNFKAEAVRIVSAWTNDPNLALSDDNASAILRLLTYEVSFAADNHGPLRWLFFDPRHLGPVPPFTSFLTCI